MANFHKRVPENVPGEFFVDITCIDCDTCRQLAPATFGETGAYAYVYAQPQTATKLGRHSVPCWPVPQDRSARATGTISPRGERTFPSTSMMACSTAASIRRVLRRQQLCRTARRRQLAHR